MLIKKSIPALLFGASFFVLLFTAHPSIGWWDSGFYAAAAGQLGLPEPGGSILYVLLGRIFAQIFFFLPAAQAVTLLSITGTSLAAVMLYFSLRVIFAHTQREAGDTPARVAAALTALSLPFLPSIWLESHVSRVYSLGLLLASLLLFLAVKIWYSEQEKEKARWFALAVYVLGIDFAAHRLNAPFIPFFIILFFWQFRKHVLNPRIWIPLAVAVLVGFSLHAFLLVRAHTAPPLGATDTHTGAQLLAWIGMERFGSESNFLHLFNRRAPLWAYQIKHMYIRYLGWNFWGTASAQAGAVVPGLLHVPLLLGIAGFADSLIRKFKTWLFGFLIFFFFSFSLVLYLNVVAGFHQTREIDRLFLPSFMVFLLWVGIGLHAGLNVLSRFLPNAGWARRLGQAAVIVLAFVLLPGNALSHNWRSCNKNKYFFPADFAYNLLQSCEKNAVLFTNGDNDTYPLWYLQQAEHVRPDVTVANVSLMNLSFYLAQLARGDHPFVLDSAAVALPLRAELLASPLEIVLPPPEAEQGLVPADTLRTTFGGIRSGDRAFLRVQDQAMLAFLQANRWRRPVCFAATVAPVNLLGLDDYLVTEGITRKLQPVKNADITPAALEKNLLHVYRYRSFNDPAVPLDRGMVLLYSNFRQAFLVLANYHLQRGDRDRAKALFDLMNEKLPDWRFPAAQNRAVENFRKRLLP